MNCLVLGGTRFFGVHLVNTLLNVGNTVTIGTRGMAEDFFGDKVSRIKLERTDPKSLEEALSGKHFDVVYDNINYCSWDTKALLDVLDTDRYIVTSSGSVYHDKDCFIEADFDQMSYQLRWCERSENTYDIGKQLMEAAVFQEYKIPSVAVRFPIVLGLDDYTKRLYSYLDKLMKGTPMKLCGEKFPFSFISSTEAGNFLAFLSGISQTGVVNAALTGTVTTAQILSYLQEKTGKTAILSDDGEECFFNTDCGFELRVEKAAAWGYNFPSLDGFLYPLLDTYIARYENE